MSCIHYKFKSSKDYDTLTFDGMHISLADLKKSILQNKRLTKSGSLDFDLQIVNAQTREVYNEAEELIPKNTSVVVARIPVGRPSKSRTYSLFLASFQIQSSVQVGSGGVPMTLERLKKTADLANAKGTEEDKMKAMMDQSTRDYDSSNYVKSKYPVGRPLTGYVCHNCSKPGHFIQNCPVKKEEGLHRAKRSTGIPASFLTPVSDPTVPGALLLQTGQYAVPTLDAAAYKEGKKEKPPFVVDKTDTNASKSEESAIPKELLCALCNDLLSDAVVIACCGNSFCDECIRDSLLDSETHTCPVCEKPDQSPDKLIPNRFLRTAVNNYLNETGYTKAKAFVDKTPSATPDISSPAVNSPNPNQSPAPSQENPPPPPPSSLGQKFHDLPPELVGLPPQVSDSDRSSHHDVIVSSVIR
ncbi:hypothetical protein CAPTEDRAFT_175258 [Capitella teleta]|uniref:E3 ubiquitin-protein ligase RBBP6 n=1 Tax=Capitella teleta TaxID=283909 RepID=R7VAV3_CAPTE|nr:hypothetical protein CAPTEDRAFT_175258 [Capitella teleta]|eukprot:ELU15719.1 hypothetical protein CAPTEDRAFT_175258 [Capitella teleta]